MTKINLKNVFASVVVAGLYINSFLPHAQASEDGSANVWQDENGVFHGKIDNERYPEPMTFGCWAETCVRITVLDKDNKRVTKDVYAGTGQKNMAHGIGVLGYVQVIRDEKSECLPLQLFIKDVKVFDDKVCNKTTGWHTFLGGYKAFIHYSKRS